MKSFFPQLDPNHLLPPIPTSSVIVIQPGTHTLRIGFASDPSPKELPHIIARRCNKDVAVQCDCLILRPEHELGNLYVGSLGDISLCDALLTDRRATVGEKAIVSKVDEVAALNKNAVFLFSSDDGFIQTAWDSVVVGEKVFSLPFNDKYIVRWPFKCDSQGRFSVVDLAVVWMYAITRILKVSADALPLYRCVLLVPDVCGRMAVRDLVSLVLEQLQFSAIIVHHESVCSCYGAGLFSSVIVDVGDQTTTISCVDEGVSEPATRIQMNVGGSDISRQFYALLLRSGVSFLNFNPRNHCHAYFLDKLKRQVCHLDLKEHGIRKYEVSLPNDPNVSVTIHLGDECLLAPLCLFSSDSLNLGRMRRMVNWEDPSLSSDDVLDDDYLLLAQSGRETDERLLANKNRPKDPLNYDVIPGSSYQEDAGIDMRDSTVFEDGDESMDSDATECGQYPRRGTNSNICNGQKTPSGNGSKAVVSGETVSVDLKKPTLDPYRLMSLQDAIQLSCERVSSTEARSRVSQNVLFVGGGLANFRGAESFLGTLNLGETACEIITKVKDMDTSQTAWKGAAIMACLESTQELWISMEEWIKFGSRTLRERAPFVW